MMEPSEIKALIEAGLTDSRVTVTGDGHHFEAIIVAAQFEGKSRIERQRMVNEILNPVIISGRLHAISMKTLTEAERG